MNFLKKFGNASWWFGDESLYAQFQPDQGKIVVPGGSYSWGDTAEAGNTVIEGVSSAKLLNYALIGYGSYLLLKAVK